MLLLEILVSPHTGIVGLRERTRARQTSAIMIFILLVLAIYTVIQMVLDASSFTLIKFYSSFMMVYFLIYAVSRTVYSRFAANAFIAAFMCQIFGSVFLPLKIPGFQGILLLGSLVIPPMGLMILPFKSALRLIFLNIVIGSVICFLPQAGLGELSVHVFALLMMGNLIVYFLAVSFMGEMRLTVSNRADSTSSEFAASIAHGVNSPLAAARAAGHRLMKRTMAADFNRDETIQLADKLNRAVDRSLLVSKALQYYVEDARSNDYRLIPAVEISQDFPAELKKLYPNVKLSIVIAENCEKVCVRAEYHRLMHALTLIGSFLAKKIQASGSDTVRMRIATEGASQDKFVIMFGDDLNISSAEIDSFLLNPLDSFEGMLKGSDIELKLATRLFLKIDGKISSGSEPKRERFRIVFDRS